MVKILFYIDDLRAGGAEKVLCNLVNNMDQTRFNITVHTTYEGDATLLAPGIHYKYVYKKQTKANHMAYRIEAELGIFYTLHLKGDYDIEVAYLECGPTKVMASSTNKKAVKIAWVHCDLEKKMGDMEAFVSQTKAYYEKYHRVVCVSEDCKKTFIRHFGMEEKTDVLYNTIDAEEILRMSKDETSTRQIAERQGFTFVSMGRLTDQKNYLMLLDCQRKLLDEGLKVFLWLIGDGPEGEKLKAYVKEKKMDAYVDFLGFLSNPFPVLAKADAYVCSSKYEGYSTAVIEALVLGKPVVTTDCTGMREILGDSQYGMILPNNKNTLTEGMRAFVSDEDLLRRYQSVSRQRGAALTGRTVTKKTETYLLNLLYEKV